MKNKAVQLILKYFLIILALCAVLGIAQYLDKIRP